MSDWDEVSLDLSNFEESGEDSEESQFKPFEPANESDFRELDDSEERLELFNSRDMGIIDSTDLRGLVESTDPEELMEAIGEFDEDTQLVMLSLIEGLYQSNGSVLDGENNSEIVEDYKPSYDVIELAQKIEPHFVERPHIRYMADRLREAVERVERGENVQMTFSMPPRVGKSFTISTYTPAWLFDRNHSLRCGIISHSPSLASTWGRSVRRMVEEHGSGENGSGILKGLELARDAKAVTNWETSQRGHLLSRSVKQALAGFGFQVLIVDDPVKDYISAHNEKYRNDMWEWWKTDVLSRMQDPYLLIVVGCLVGSTQVSMADGSTKPIRDIEVGDEVVTYLESGELSSSKVSHHTSVGMDYTYTITTKSGRVLKANKAHPFLTYSNGKVSWQRVENLAEQERSLLVIGENIEVSHAQEKVAQSKQSAEECALSITTNGDGLQEKVKTLQKKIDERTLDTVMESAQRNMTSLSGGRKISALSVVKNLTGKTPTVVDSSSSTITMTQEQFENFFATPVTSLSQEETVLKDWNPLLDTSNVTLDTIVSVVREGYQELFDIEVENHHTFVANGAVTHNTRWHHDDLIGRILSDKYEGDPNDWEQIVFPAIATAESIDPVTGTDKLGRKVGEPLISPLVKDETKEQALVRWARIEENVGSSTWASLYQQSPTPDTGGIFDMSRVKFWTTEPGIYNGDPDNTILIDAPMLERMRGGYWVDSWDTSFKGGETSDFVVGQRWVRVGAFRFLIAQKRGRWGYNDTLHQMRQWSNVEGNPGSLLDPSPFGRYVHRRVIEEKANGAALIESLSQDVSGIKAVNPKLGKEARARIITPEFESGHVVLPHPDTPGFDWVNSLYEELKGFPHSSHDDQVDALTQALAELRETPSVQVSDPSLSTQRIDRRYLTVEGAHAFRESASPSGMGGLSARIPGR